MAIRAFYPRENQLTEAQMRTVRLDALEHRIEAFPASIDAIFARHKEELISGIKALMQEQMEAMAQRLYEAGVLDEMPQFSVETKSSNQDAATKVFEEMPAAKVQSVHSNVRQASAVTVHETRSNFHERQETVGGFGERLDNLGGRRLSIELIKGSHHDKVESSSTKKPEVTTEDQNTPSDMDVGISVNKTGGKGSPFLSKIGLILGIGNSCSDYIGFVGEGKSGSEVLAEFSPYNCLVVGRGTAKVRLKCLIRQPEQPLPPPEPPPPAILLQFVIWVVEVTQFSVDFLFF